MKKVLQISMGETYGGIEELEKNFSLNIDKYKVDILTPTKLFDNDNCFDLNISRNTFLGKLKYNHRLSKFLKNNHYDIVHINSSIFLFSFQVARITRKAKVKHVIAHFHSIPKNSKLKNIIIKILMPFYKRKIDVFLACSKEASITDNTIIINNGIDIDKFKFNKTKRDKYRKELNLTNKKVYGHIGRFDHNKNHEFLIDVFSKILEKEKDSYLLLIGIGELESEIRKKVDDLNISDNVIFLGYREDINYLLDTMDIFLFPSIKEGLGLVLVEAQTSGLPVVVSNGIPDSANINNFYKISSFDINTWINTIQNIKILDRNNSYKDTINRGYSIKDSTKRIEKIYKDLIK